MRRSAILLFCLIFFTGMLFSQELRIEKMYPVTDNSVKIEMDYADAEIKHWNGAEIQITGTALINQGEDNDALVIETSQSGETLIIDTYIKDVRKLPSLIIGLKDGKKMYLGKTKSEGGYGKWRNWKDDEKFSDYAEYEFDDLRIGPEIEVALTILVPKGIDLEVYSTYGDIDLQDPEGDFDIKNTYGYIDARFSSAPRADITLFSTYDFVDVTLPDNANVDFVLNTNYGEILTDLDLKIDRARSESGSFHEVIAAKLNNGGPTLKLKATYDKIYVRKGS